ncbi:MAG TPA: small ribosomal subunit Rsm22 family protein [Terriglobales bacterium]|nr:small ribosomal subunit Rsm22 family protein [Terriglobales bacterium]
MLPPELAAAIAALNAEIPRGDLARTVAELSSQYRAKTRSRPQLTAMHRTAYLAARLPATYAVIARVIREAQLRVPGLRVESMIDLGAGPGAAMWAAAEQFPDLARILLIEDSAGWVEMGRRLSSSSGNSAIRNADWRQGSVTREFSLESFDFVIASYLMNEIPVQDRTRVALAAWQCTKKLLVIIEPGTPEGFANIRSLRQELIAAGGYIAAPCPHANDCPIAAGDWCHFSERLERTSEHRRAKGGERGYEDEKYSYLIFSREPVVLPAARILRHPRKHPGHAEFELCTAEGLKRETISRKQGERYKTAKKAEWGETL